MIVIQDIATSKLRPFQMNALQVGNLRLFRIIPISTVICTLLPT